MLDIYVLGYRKRFSEIRRLLPHLGPQCRFCPRLSFPTLSAFSTIAQRKIGVGLVKRPFMFAADKEQCPWFHITWARYTGGKAIEFKQRNKQNRTNISTKREKDEEDFNKPQWNSALLTTKMFIACDCPRSSRHYPLNVVHDLYVINHTHWASTTLN